MTYQDTQPTKTPTPVNQTPVCCYDCDEEVGETAIHDIIEEKVYCNYCGQSKNA